MPNESATYYWLSCSAKVDNLLEPRCQARSEGGFHDQDTVRKRAQVAGWTSPTKTTDFCPAHSVAPRSDSVVRGSLRSPRAAAPVQPIEQVSNDGQQ